MRQQQENDQDQIRLTYSEKKLIEELRFHKFAAPSADELNHLKKWRTVQLQQGLDLANFIEEHQDSLSGAIHNLLGSVLHMEDIFSLKETQRAYNILYTFQSILNPPPEMDL